MRTVLSLTLGLMLVSQAHAEPANITVRVNEPGHKIAPSLYGIFFEEINHAGDGGLYAELIQNRSFDETLPVEGCTVQGDKCVAPSAACYATGKINNWQVPWKFASDTPAWSLLADLKPGFVRFPGGCVVEGLTGLRIRCFLDGQLIHDVERQSQLPSLYAVAGRKNDTGEIILKVVNAANAPADTAIDLKDAGNLAPTATATVLASASPDDENSLDEPTKVTPKEITIQNVAPSFRHTFPANSVTVMRLRNR